MHLVQNKNTTQPQTTESCVLVSLPNFSCGGASWCWIQQPSTWPPNSQVNSYCSLEVTFQEGHTAFFSAFIKVPPPSVHSWLLKTLREHPQIPKGVKQQGKGLAWIAVDESLRPLWNISNNTTFYSWGRLLLLDQTALSHPVFPLHVEVALQLWIQGPLTLASTDHQVDREDLSLISLWMISKPDFEIQLVEQLKRLPYLLNRSVVCVTLDGFNCTFLVSSPSLQNKLGDAWLVFLTYDPTTCFLCSLCLNWSPSTMRLLPDSVNPLVQSIQACRARGATPSGTHVSASPPSVEMSVRVLFLPENVEPLYLNDFYQSIHVDGASCLVYEVDAMLRFRYAPWYRHSALQHVLKPYSQEDRETSGVGTRTLHSFIGKLVNTFCRYRWRYTVDSWAAHQVDQQHQPYYHLILMFRHLQVLDVAEWRELGGVLCRWNHEIRQRWTSSRTLFCSAFLLSNTPLDQEKLQDLYDCFNLGGKTCLDIKPLTLDQKTWNINQNLFPTSGRMDISSVKDVQGRKKKFHPTPDWVSLLKRYQAQMNKPCEVLSELLSLHGHSIHDMSQVVQPSGGASHHSMDDLSLPLTPGQQSVADDMEFYIFLAVKRQDLFGTFGHTYHPRALLYGPSGSGKSFLLNYLHQKNNDLHVRTRHITSFYSPYVGETEKRLRKAMKKMEVPGIFVLEGLELFSSQRTSHEPPINSPQLHQRKLLVTLLLCLDGFHDDDTKRHGQLGHSNN